MVLFNAPSKIVACPGQAKAACGTAAEADKTPGTVFDWHLQQEFRAGAYALTDYNFRDPGLDLGVQKKTRAAIGGNDAFEIFDYPGEYQALGAGDKRAQLRMEAEECAAHAVQGQSSCYAFTPGYKFDLVGHTRSSFNDSYLITTVHHTFSQPVGSGGRGTGNYYRNAFSCAPHALPYRPLQTTPKPVIQGAQTATVVGEGGKEIDIDELGCVVVKFHWDRYSQGNASSSCRIRVSEGWGGKGWGAFFAPRIGQEVIVEFLEGDPDRPIGIDDRKRYMHHYNMPPYSNGEHMGIKSQSTPKGGATNFNEIRMEDSKGKELFYIQAEKDKEVFVKHDDRLTVGANRSEMVTENRSISVGGNHGEQTVSGLSAETVTLAKAMTCGAAYQVSVGAILNETVVGARMEEVGLFRMEIVGGTSTEKIGGKKKVSSSGDMSLSTKKALSLSADDKGYLKSKKKLFLDAKKSIVIESEMDITLRAGKAEIVLKKDGGVIEIRADKIKIEGKSETKIKSGKVSIN